MTAIDVKKQWWIVVVTAAVADIAAMVIIDRRLPGMQLLGVTLLLGLVGAGFCWAYLTDKVRLWWAVIPVVAAFVLLTAILVDRYIGAGAAVIAALLIRRDARLGLIIVVVITVLVGITLAPVTPILKGVLIGLDILAGIVLMAYAIWLSRRRANQ